MAISCDVCPLRTLKLARSLTQHELRAVKRFKLGEIEVAPRSDVIRAGERSPHLFTVLEGVAFRHHTLEDGRRQILNFLFPADFVGLQASLFEESPYSVTTLTPARLCLFDRQRIGELFRETPELAYDVVWMTAEQQTLVDHNLVAIGKFRSEQRIAYFLLTFWTRMREAGLAEGLSCAMPATQSHIADALGLSQPYANAALGKLRADGLIRLAEGRLDILDMERLRAAAVTPPESRKRMPFV